MDNQQRKSWDEYFMDISKAIAGRATCDRGYIGCVIVKEKQILTTGYVGSPPGQPHCDEVGHLIKATKHEDGRVSQHCVRTSHAEMNAICQAAKRGIALEGATLYGKFEPCHNCAKAIITSGIKRVIVEKLYHAGQDTRKLFEAAGVKLEVLNPVVQEYEGQTLAPDE